MNFINPEYVTKLMEIHVAAGKVWSTLMQQRNFNFGILIHIDLQ